MIIHEIHDLSNESVVEFLKLGIVNSAGSDKLVNYHPKFEDSTGNLFYVLRDGRFSKGRGKYFIIEQDGEYVCSAGWNEYDYDPTTALVLTRMFVNPKYRAQYFAGKYILPKAIEETAGYDKVWITSNHSNYMIYKWFERASQGKRSALFNDWPEIYRNFKPIGLKEVYFTEQFVVELDRTKND